MKEDEFSGRDDDSSPGDSYLVRGLLGGGNVLSRGLPAAGGRGEWTRGRPVDGAVTDCGCRGNGKCPVRPNLRTRRLRMSTNVKRGTESTARPAPRQLATSTDLKPEDVRTISEAVNPLIADAFALYVKTKNFHWHLAGPRFRDYHLLFDEQAGAILESIDPLAERVRKLGGTTIRGIGHIGRLQTIKDDDDDFVPTSEMIQRLLADNRRIAEQQRRAIEVCDSRGDTPTGNLLQEILDQTERRIWFLYELSQADA